MIFCDRLSRSDLDKNDLDKNRLSGFKVPESRHDFIRIDVEGDVSHLTTGISLAFQLLSLSLRNYNKEHNIRKHPQYGDQQRHSHERNDIIGVDYSVGKFDCNGNCDCLCLCGCQSMPGVVTVQEIDLSTAVDEIKGDDLSQIAEAQTTESEGDSSVTIGRKNRRKWRVVARMANDVKESGDESKRDVEQEELKSKTEHTVSLMVREMIGIADCNDFVDEKTPDDENRDVNARHDSHERPVAKFAPPDHFDYGLNWMECLLLFVTCLERNKLEHLSLIVDNHCRFFSQWECVFAGRVDHFHCSDFSSMQLIRLLTELLGGVGFITLLNNSNITVKEWGWSGMQHCASGSELSVFSSDHCVEWIRVKRYDIILRVCEYRHHVQRIWCVFNNTITMRSIIALVDPPINFCATSRDSTNHLRFSQLRVCDSKCSTVSCSHASRYKKLYYTLRAMECELLTSRLADRDITANTLVVIDQRPYICFHTVCGGGAYISLFRRLHYDLRVRRNEATRHNLSDSCNDDIEEAATDDDADVLIVCRGTAARLGERSGLSSVFDDFSWDIGNESLCALFVSAAFTLRFLSYATIPSTFDISSIFRVI